MGPYSENILEKFVHTVKEVQSELGTITLSLRLQCVSIHKIYVHVSSPESRHYM